MSEVVKISKGRIMSENPKVIEAKINLSSDNSLKIVMESFSEASKRVGPLWDVRDYVAVNPFFGFKDRSFLEVANYVRDISNKNIVPKKSFFLKKYETGEITEYDLEVAIKLCQRESQNRVEVQVSTEELINFIRSTDDESKELRNRVLSDLFDIENQENITELITNEVSKWASAYFDEGQALWKIETKEVRFYSWWRSLAKYDKPFKAKTSQFSKFIQSLPPEPNHALQMLTKKLLEKTTLNKDELTDYYYRLIYTILGWSSYIQKFEFEASRSGERSKLQEIGGLIDIVAIRMAYDIFLLNDISEVILKPEPNPNCDDSDLDYSYIWLNAAENAYRRKIEEILITSKQPFVSESRHDIQMAFCIDVRSEVLRRHLEKSSQKIQTIGFAGFFGMPISLKGLGHHESDQNCPVLLNSAYEIKETALQDENSLLRKKQRFASAQYLKRSMQGSANSGFSFVETFGFGYVGKILSAGLGQNKPNIDISSLGLSEQEKKLIDLTSEHLKKEAKVSLAYGALKNMGLTRNFAKYVFFFGHGSESSNNPYSSALDCGACAGHNGQGNAKFLTSLLNDKEIKIELNKKGIDIPEDTLFLSGWHNTAKDELLVEGIENISHQQKSELSEFNKIFDEASKNCRKERAQKLPWCSNLKDDELKNEFDQKANDWSEIRPEWGLARNASFIVGRRGLTRGLNLDGRSFLHDYDQNQDHDLSILELIMTAPMIVTNWINMQYYASTVDPQKFGAGNKVLNNVIGGIGCIQGNESDLLGGLTEQSVWYKGDYFHEPIRLQVFIEAETSAIEKIINKHQMVKELLENGWLKVVSINPKNNELKLYHNNTWIQTKEDLWN